MKYKQLVALDHEEYPIHNYFHETNEFLDSAFREGGKVLVHCHGGVSRSASIVIAYLIYSQNLDFEKALSLVQLRRPIALPNTGFQRQLKEYRFLFKQPQD